MIDFAPDLETPDDNALSTISELARQQIAAQAEVESITKQLEVATKRLRDLKEVQLPAAMTAVGMSNFTLKDGTRVKIDVDYACGITEQRKAEAFAWLRRNAYDQIIKRQVGVKFGRGEDSAAASLLASLYKTLPAAQIFDNESVHAQTLKAFVKEIINEQTEAAAAGRTPPEFPRELFGVFELIRATIKPSRKSE